MIPTPRLSRPTAAIVLSLGLALLPILGATTGCATNPVTGRTQLALISEQQEIAMGRQSHEQILATMGAYDDPELQAYLDRLGQELAAASERPDLPWTFTVIDDPSVNAFALPGGYIYLTRGILAHMRSEAEMVSVLGHEIGHVTARHAVERLSKAQLANFGLLAGMVVSPELRGYGDLAQTGLGVMFLKFSRDDERQADDLGFAYMNRAGYDPHEMIEMFRVLDRVSAGSGQGRLPDWLATHPNPGDRIERIQGGIAASVPAQLGTTVHRAAFLQHLDGMEFGMDPREGYFRGSVFYHPELAFQLRFPEGWQTQNRKQAVLAVSPEEDAIVALSLAEGTSPEQAASGFFQEQAIRPGRSWRNRIGGLPAVSRTFVVERQQGQSLAGLVAFVEDGGRVYRLLGYTAEDRLGRYDRLFADALGSFEQLRDRRFLDVQPKRLDLVRLPEAMSLREANRRYPSTVDLETVALINHVAVDGAFGAGDRYKRVVGGELP